MGGKPKYEEESDNPVSKFLKKFSGNVISKRLAKEDPTRQEPIHQMKGKNANSFANTQKNSKARNQNPKPGDQGPKGKRTV